jgi:hypothetical protein
MSDSFKEYPSAAIARQQAKAIDVALGNPRRGVNVGRGPHAQVPDVYSPGAVGWTASECDVLVDASSGNALLVMSDAAEAKHGVTVRVDGVDVTVSVRANSKTKPAKYRLPGEK